MSECCRENSIKGRLGLVLSSLHTVIVVVTLGHVSVPTTMDNLAVLLSTFIGAPYPKAGPALLSAYPFEVAVDLGVGPQQFNGMELIR